MHTYKQRSFSLLSLALLSGIVLGGFSAPSNAANRALLIGVGAYDSAIFDGLPGVSHDIAMMRDVAEFMGFKASEIKTLQDRDATLLGVEQAIKSWLIDATSANDRVLLYFSGHGSRIPDESGDEHSDNADEVLVMHDVENTQLDGSNTLRNVMLDERFGELLAQIPSQYMWVVIDACHSGTVTRAGGSSRMWKELPTHKKNLVYSDMPSPPTVAAAVLDKEDQRTDTASAGRYALISAATDGQKTLATAKGSLFTIGVYEAFNAAARENRSMNMLDLKRSVDAFLVQNISDGAARATPSVLGANELISAPVLVRAPAVGRGPNWRAIEQAARHKEEVHVALNQATYQLADPITIDVSTNNPGYLNIVAIDAHDQVIVLFPNALDRQNLMTSERFRLSKVGKELGIHAAPPLGATLIAGIVSSEPLNLYTHGSAPQHAGPNKPLRRLSAEGRQILVRALWAKRAVGNAVITTVCDKSDMGCLSEIVAK